MKIDDIFQKQMFKSSVITFLGSSVLLSGITFLEIFLLNCLRISIQKKYYHGYAYIYIKKIRNGLNSNNLTDTVSFIPQVYVSKKYYIEEKYQQIIIRFKNRLFGRQKFWSKGKEFVQWGNVIKSLSDEIIVINNAEIETRGLLNTSVLYAEVYEKFLEKD